MQQQQQTQQGWMSAVVNTEQPTVMTVPPRGQFLPAATMDQPLMKKQEKDGGRKVELLDSVERHEDDVSFPDELPVDLFMQGLRPKKAPKPTIAADVSKTTAGTSLLPELSSFDHGEEEEEEEDEEEADLVVPDAEEPLDPTVPDTATVPNKKKKQLELQPTPRMKLTDPPPALPEPSSFDGGEEEEEADLVVPDVEEPLDPTMPDTATVSHKKKQLELQPTPCMKLTDPSPAAVQSSSLLSSVQNNKKKTRTPKTGTILRPTPRSTTTCNSSSRRMDQSMLSTLPATMKKPPVLPPSTSTKKRATPRPPSSSNNKKKKPTPKVAVENSISRPTRLPPPADPPLGQRLQNKFDGRYYSGVINEIWYDDDGKKLWHVKYGDGDEEDLDINQIMTDTNILWLESEEEGLWCGF